MGDSGKPFACTEIGCNQRFVNEDHLEVHRRKHEMSLGLRDLKSLDTPIIADQTPTPTRFLKNCEEAGFFNEPPNPFDALFRRASTLRGTDATECSKVEGDSSLDVSEPEVELEVAAESVIEESSHQSVSSTTGDEIQQQEPPAILDELSGSDISTEIIEVATVSPVKSPVQQTVLPMPKQTQAASIQSISIASSQITSPQQTFQVSQNIIPISGQIILRLPNGQTIPVVPPSVANPQAPIPIAIPAVTQASVVITRPSESIPLDSQSVKQKLKNSLLTNQSQGNMGVMTQAVDVVTRQQGMAHQDTDATFAVNSSEFNDGQAKRRRRNSDMSSDEKRERFLERNRAAATRCRNKRKQWITNLEKRADELNSTNSTLMSEVGKLKEEVAQLKQLLLAHSDCPVTVMQRETHGNLLAGTPNGSRFTASLEIHKKVPSMTASGDAAGSPSGQVTTTEQKPLLR